MTLRLITGGIQKRATVRIDIDRLTTEMHFDDEEAGPPMPGVLLNLSAGGALIEMRQRVAVGTVARLSFGLPDGGTFFLSSTAVRVLPAVPAARGYRVGLEFSIDSGTDMKLMRWIFREFARRRERHE